MKRSSRYRALLATLLFATALRADPLHPIAGGAYWHHDSNFLFPAVLAGFERVGAPQEIDGTARIVAYYAAGEGAMRRVVIVEVAPLAAAVDELALRNIERAGWRVLVKASGLDTPAADRIEALTRALPVERLGAIDARCPNAGCGS